MTQTATVQARVEEDDAPEAIPTASGLAQPILVDDLGEVKKGLRSAAKSAGITVIPVHSVNLPGLQLDVADTKEFLQVTKNLGAKQVYLWNEPLHPRATLEAHLGHIDEALSEMDDDSDDLEEQEAAQELAQELEQAKQVLIEHGALMHGAGFLVDGVMHEVFFTEENLVDALIVLSSLLEVSGGREDDDLDDDLHEMDVDDAAKRIIDHIEDDMEVPPREMKRRANELARQAAHQLVDHDDLSPAERQRVQQAIKMAALRMRKG